MKIAELKDLPNWQASAVDNETSHAVAIVRADRGGFHLYDGNSVTTPYPTQIKHSDGTEWFSIDEIRQMFATRRFSVLDGYLER